MKHVADGQVADGVSADGVTRPEPAEPIIDRVRAWVAWFGFARIVVSAASMVIVCAGAFWLVRSPPPPAEAVLPQATAIAAPLSTLSTLPGVDEVSARTTKPTAVEATVHVAGAVVFPGVYLLPPGARVDDAVAAAGGSTQAADLDALNLAAAVADGVRIYVPEHGEEVDLLTPAAPVVTGVAGPVDINRADVGQLDALPGVGPATAAAIVAERERNGPFLTVDDLERVPGIGPAKLAGLRDLVVA